MASSVLLSSATTSTLVADSVKPRIYKQSSTRLVTSADPALQYYSDTCGVFREAGGGGARILLTTAAPALYAASGDAVILVTPIDANGVANPASVTAATAGTNFTLDTTNGNGTWFWEIRSVA